MSLSFRQRWDEWQSQTLQSLLVCRCCTSKSCGCSRAGLGCSTACTCRGFKLVCANATPPVAAPVSKPSSDSDAAGKKRPAQGEAGPWQGQARKLADDPFALAQAKSARDATREAFLARLEAEQHAAAAGSGGGGDGAAAVPGRDSEDDLSDDVPIAASKRQDDAAGPSLGRNNYGGGSAAAAAAPAAAARKDVVDLVDLCDSDDDDVRVVSVSGGGRAGVPSATTSVGGAAAGRGAGAVSTSASAPSARGATASAAAAAGPSKPNPAAANPRSPARYDPFQPRQYVPAGGFSALLRGGELRVNESAELQNVDGGWDRGLTACLDTGNEGCTLLNIGAAARAGLVDPVTGEPVGSFGRCETVEVRGVVAGASERVPLMSARYRISGKEMRVRSTDPARRYALPIAQSHPCVAVGASARR